MNPGHWGYFELTNINPLTDALRAAGLHLRPEMRDAEVLWLDTNARAVWAGDFLDFFGYGSGGEGEPRRAADRTIDPPRNFRHALATAGELYALAARN